MAPLLQVTDTPIPMGSYIAWSTVFLLVFYVLIVLTAKFILKVNVSKFVLPEDLLREMHEKQINAKEKMAVAVLFAYVLVLVVPAIFTSMPGAAFINKLGVGGISGIAILLLAALRYEGKGLVDLVKVFSKVDWTLFFLVAVTYPIADLIKHADSGIMPTIMGFIMPIVSGMGALTFLIVSMIALGLVTQVTHNIVLAAMFEPFLLPIYAQLGGNMYTMWFILTFTLNMAYCTPAGSFQAALVFGHEQMEKKHAYTYGIMLLVLIWIVSIVCGLPLGNALFGSLI